jgi:hypothetical protein
MLTTVQTPIESLGMSLQKQDESAFDVFVSDTLSGELLNQDFRSKVLQMQDAMSQQPQIDCHVDHVFAPGLYARQIQMPAGALVVGKIHKHAHVNTISRGRCIVATEFGYEELTAPHTFVSKPGTKRAVYVLEDTVWTTYHPTEETDLGKIEDHVIAKSYDEYLEFSGDLTKCIKED